MIEVTWKEEVDQMRVCSLQWGKEINAKGEGGRRVSNIKEV